MSTSRWLLTREHACCPITTFTTYRSRASLLGRPERICDGRRRPALRPADHDDRVTTTPGVMGKAAGPALLTRRGKATCAKKSSSRSFSTGNPAIRWSTHRRWYLHRPQRRRLRPPRSRAPRRSIPSATGNIRRCSSSRPQACHRSDQLPPAPGGQGCEAKIEWNVRSFGEASELKTVASRDRLAHLRRPAARVDTLMPTASLGTRLMPNAPSCSLDDPPA